jgi:His-Xaa-Ser system radical SAM maturase HxsB
MPLDRDRYLLTNLVGEYVVLQRDDLVALVRKQLTITSEAYSALKLRHFLIDETSRVALDLLAAKYRTKLAPVANFTGLHIFAVTLRCNNRCIYCQVSSQSPDRARCDMTPDIADKAVEFMFHSPAQALKVEFQGGEPLLNFEVVKRIVQRAMEINKVERRDLEFVICTNLTLLTDEIVSFIQTHDICVSTSIDGGEALHNRNRPSPAKNSYRTTVANIQRLQEAIGPRRISALMTTTRSTLNEPESLIDEYIRLGFDSIFLRILNPYGRSAGDAGELRYSVDEWLDFYQRALRYIIELNKGGLWFREDYASIVLRKVLTPYGTGFVDLQSPSGTGISVLVYNYDGGIYASDEARMLAEMGDKRFLLGDVVNDRYDDVIFSERLMELIKTTMLEGVPQCADCALRPFCGADPVRHYRLQGDIVGHKPTSEFCKKNTFIIKHLITLLETDDAARRVLYSWI